MSKKKVAFVINDLLIGGAQAVVLGIASSLDRIRFDTHVYYLRAYESDRTFIKQYDDFHVPHTHLGGKGLVKKARMLARALRANHIDIVHCHLPDSVMVGVLAARMAGVPVVIHEHNTHQFHSWKIRLAYRIARLFANVTICYTSSVEEELFDGVHEWKGGESVCVRQSYTIPNAVDTIRIKDAAQQRDRARAMLGVSDTETVIMSISRLIRWKGHALLIDAFAEAAARMPSTRLYIVGDGPERESLEQRIRTHGLEGRVVLLGPRTDAYELLAAADIASLAFTYEPGMDAEPVGVAGFEALAAGLPLIASRYDSLSPYVVDGVNCVLVTPHNATELAAALVRLAGDPVLRSRLGKAGQQTIESNLSWSRIAPRYEHLYEAVLSGC